MSSLEQLQIATTQPLIIEPRVRVKEDRELQAFSVVDAGSRYEGIAPYLTQTELQQLVQLDENEAITAHWAEIAGLPVMPYSLVMLDGSVGSLQIVYSRDGTPKPIFRRVTDMLAASVEKNPDNDRAYATLYSFKKHIEPKLRQLKLDDTLAFFSPPDWGGKHEYEYGFLYLLRRQHTQNLANASFAGFAVKLDLTKEEYENLFFWQQARRGIPDFESTFDELVAASVFSFSSSSVDNVIRELLGPVRGLSGESIELLGKQIPSLAQYIQESLSQYHAIRQQMKTRGKTYFNALAAGNHQGAEVALKQIQMELLWQTNPTLLIKALLQASLYGESKVLLPCGFVYLAAGRLSERNMALMGIMDPDNDVWVCDNCGHLHYIDARNGKMEKFCHGCGESGEC